MTDDLRYVCAKLLVLACLIFMVFECHNQPNFCSCSFLCCVLITLIIEYYVCCTVVRKLTLYRAYVHSTTK